MHIYLLLMLILIAGVLLIRKAKAPPATAAAKHLRELTTSIDTWQEAGNAVPMRAVALLRDEPNLDISRISTFMCDTWKLADLESGPGTCPAERTLRFGEATIVIEPVDLSPGEEFPLQIRPLGRARVPAGTTGGILITATSPGGGAIGSLALSQAALAIVNSCPQVASVYWMSSEAIFTTTDILRGVNNLETAWPVDIWVSCHAFKNTSGSVDGYTLGLAAMGGTEFECLDAPVSERELRRTLAAITHFVIFDFGITCDPDSIGVDPRITFEDAASQTIHRGSVVQLQY